MSHDAVPDRYTYGALCLPCHLHTGPSDTGLTSLGRLFLLHGYAALQPKSAWPDRWPCQPEWELVKVKVTPPVGESRTHPFAHLAS